MQLRLKLTLTLLAVLTPAALVTSAAEIALNRHEFQARRVERFATRATALPLSACGQRPLKQPRPNVALLYGYTHDLRPAHPSAPPFPEALAQALEEDDLVSLPALDAWRLGGMTAVRRVGAPPECEVLLLAWVDPGDRRRGARRRATMRHDAMRQALWRVSLLAILIALTGFTMTAPLTRRIRKLTRAIADAPEDAPRLNLDSTPEDELGELARAFDTMGERVQQTIADLRARDQALKDYISHTTHDLNTPLTVLQHRLRHMQHAAETGQIAAREDLTAALEESYYIGGLIANMGAAARLDAADTALSLARAELAPLVERVAQRLAPIARQREVELNWAAPPEPIYAMIDATLLERALSNLAQNAVQYNRAGGHVSILLEQLDAHTFELQVLDDGPGIPEALLPHVTSRAVRGDDARSRNPGGQGFGLAITARVAQALDMTLSLESMPEGGLRATLRGTIVTPPPSAPGAEPLAT